MVTTYIHRNAIHHGLSSGLGMWENDSYFEIAKQLKGFLMAKETANWFGGREKFIQHHLLAVEEYKSSLDFVFSETAQQP